MDKPYRDFSDLLAEHFTTKMQKLAINAGFTCPNRDGTVGTGGCTYCNNQSFNPEYCSPSLSVTEQIEQGRLFFARKYPNMRYLAYFQAYTNTHAPVEGLMEMYAEALGCEGVEGLIIGTRPDCMPDSLLERLSRLHRDRRVFVMIEYGAESSHTATLEMVNRCHTWDTTASTVRRTAEAGLLTGLHLINGLPGESDDMILQTVERINELPVDTVKFHQLQLIKGTRMARDVAAGLYDIRRWEVDEYIDLCCRIVATLRRDIAIERFVSQSPPSLCLYPRWGLKNHEFTDRLKAALRAKTAR